MNESDKYSRRDILKFAALGTVGIAAERYLKPMEGFTNGIEQGTIPAPIPEEISAYFNLVETVIGRDKPLDPVAIKHFLLDLQARNTNPPFDQTSIYSTWTFYPEGYKNLGPSFGFEKTEEWLSFNLHVLNNMFDKAKDNYTGKPQLPPFPHRFVARRLAVIEEGTSFPGPFYTSDQLPDSYAAEGHPWIDPNYTSMEDTAYVRKAEVTLKGIPATVYYDGGLLHEFGHKLGFPDLYANDVVAIDDPYLKRVPEKFRYFFSGELYGVGEDGGLMSSQGNIAEPYLLWTLSNRFTLEYNPGQRYQETYWMRGRAFAQDTVTFQIKNTLPESTHHVRVLRTKSTDGVQTSSYDSMDEEQRIELFSGKNELQRKQQTATNKKLIQLETVPVKDLSSITIRHPWSDFYMEDSHDPDIWVHHEDATALLLFEDKDGNPTALRWMPIDQLTCLQNVHKSFHESNLQANMSVVRMDQLPPERHEFDWNINRLNIPAYEMPPQITDLTRRSFLSAVFRR